ncbi:carboxy methyl transferase for protein phosphatase 2A [Coemansia sp. Benny D115]|nr:carboxy methyl transferase for protein phosphatase 2A [Coemansia sp. Benny D115]
MIASTEGDAPVQGTSNDAAVSRESAARLGYINDPFIRSFVRHPSRRPPIINLGTHSRFHGVQRTLRQFIQNQQQSASQVVILGSGLDTSYFLLAQQGLRAKRYYEIDFAEINTKKASAICRNQAMRALLPKDIEVAAGGTELHSSEYCLLSADLRELHTSVVPKLVDHGFDRLAPTLFISECVLIYLEPRHSDAILDWITQEVPTAAVLTYEQVLPHDRFGKMMIENLRNRGIELRGLMAYPTMESSRNRFLSRGWSVASAVDLDEYHKKCIDSLELTRLSRIEFVDEWEEFSLLAKHYAFTFAVTSSAECFTAMDTFN